MRVVGDEAPKLKRVQQDVQPNLLDRLELTPEQRQDGRDPGAAACGDGGVLGRAPPGAARHCGLGACRAAGAADAGAAEIEKRFMEERRVHMEKRDRERRESNKW
jgi:hypothetical protein